MKLSQLNWKVRVKSKKFWIAIIPAVLYLANLVLGWFGLGFDLEVIGSEALAFVESLFGVLMIVGIVVDPTTPGISDSDIAMKN